MTLPPLLNKVRSLSSAIIRRLEFFFYFGERNYFGVDFIDGKALKYLPGLRIEDLIFMSLSKITFHAYEYVLPWLLLNFSLFNSSSCCYGPKTKDLTPNYGLAGGGARLLRKVRNFYMAVLLIPYSAKY
jgi:hypothetical protein